MAIREQEAEIDAIRGVKSKTSDLINKLRKRINLVIDAINNSRGEVQPLPQIVRANNDLQSSALGNNEQEPVQAQKDTGKNSRPPSQTKNNKIVTRVVAYRKTAHDRSRMSCDDELGNMVLAQMEGPDYKIGMSQFLESNQASEQQHMFKTGATQQRPASQEVCQDPDLKQLPPE